MATEYTADLIERLRKRQQELREENERIANALAVLVGRREPAGRRTKRSARERPAPFLLHRTPTR